MAVKWYF